MSSPYFEGGFFTNIQPRNPLQTACQPGGSGSNQVQAKEREGDASEASWPARRGYRTRPARLWPGRGGHGTRFGEQLRAKGSPCLLRKVSATDWWLFMSGVLLICLDAFCLCWWEVAGVCDSGLEMCYRKGQFVHRPLGCFVFVFVFESYCQTPSISPPPNLALLFQARCRKQLCAPSDPGWIKWSEIAFCF